MCKSSPKLAESGTTLSASPPLDSLPGVGDGITSVTSICGTTHPKMIDFCSFCWELQNGIWIKNDHDRYSKQSVYLLQYALGVQI